MPLLGNPHCLLPRPVLVPGKYPHNIHAHTLDPGLAALSVLPLHHPKESGGLVSPVCLSTSWLFLPNYF